MYPDDEKHSSKRKEEGRAHSLCPQAAAATIEEGGGLNRPSVRVRHEIELNGRER
jgi:hypothetical protein